MNKFQRGYLISFIGLTIFTFPTSFYLANNSNIKNSTQPLQKPKTDYITIKAVGDIVPGTNFPDYRLPRNPNQLFPKPVRDKLKNSEILFGNYESTLTNHFYSTKDTSKEMVFAFRSPPEYAKLFSQVGFDVMSVANNHSMDFGKIGFSDTVNNLNAAGVKTVGAKNQILYTKVKNIPVAWIGFCFYKYCNTVQDIQKAKALVNQAKQKAKIVIISMHVGAEGHDVLHVRNQTEYFYGENRGNSVLFARSMVDAGADLILGHGPHVPRAMEIYKGKLIAYSLGNFLGYKTFSTTAEKGNSLILEAKLNQDGDFVSGKIDAIQLDKTGTPQVDKYGRTIDLVRSLTKRSFPNTKISINRKGEINFPESEVARKNTSK